VGSRGPVPKRDAQRRRRNKPETETKTAPGKPVAVVVPEPDPAWHPMARDWFTALSESGQAVWYQPSDWQTARIWAEVLSRQLSSGRVSAQMIAAWAGAATELLTTEGARRRAKVELEQPKADADEDAAVADLDRWRVKLGS